MLIGTTKINDFNGIFVFFFITSHPSVVNKSYEWSNSINIIQGKFFIFLVTYFSFKVYGIGK